MKREAPNGNQRSSAPDVREEEGRKGEKKASRFRGDHQTLGVGEALRTRVSGWKNRAVRPWEKELVLPEPTVDVATELGFGHPEEWPRNRYQTNEWMNE